LFTVNRYTNVRCVIYTGDIGVTPNEILRGVRQRFNIELPRTGPTDIHFAYLQRRLWVEASRYPIFTLIGQSFGSIILGFEALFACLPDVYLDTMGYAFTLPVFRFATISQPLTN
jgi:alpha-1,2-mannosyltransferase